MRRLCLCLCLSLCLLPASASAKGIAKAVACGATACRDATPRGHDAGIVEGGPLIAPPSTRAPWYRLRVTIGGPDMPEGPPLTIVYVPALHVIRVTGSDRAARWMAPTDHSEEALKAAITGLVPFDAQTLDLSSPGPAVKARVVEVVPAPSAGDPPSSDAGWLAWVAGGAGALLLLGGAGVLVRRRRAGPDPHPAA